MVQRLARETPHSLDERSRVVSARQEPTNRVCIFILPDCLVLVCVTRLEIHSDNVLLTSLNSIDLVNMHKEVKISINGDKV